MEISNNEIIDINRIYEIRKETGVLLLLNCPKQMLIGIDNNSWVIGEKFMGIKLIPIGPHYIFYSLSSEDHSFKQGFFIYVEPSKKIFIRKWDAEVEDFVTLNEENQENFIIGVENLDFDRFLGNYPQNNSLNWKFLTNYIIKELIEKLEPISKKYITTSKEYESENVHIKGNIYYTALPTKQFHHKVDPNLLTKESMDKSKILLNIIEKDFSNNFDILFGELQFSFITFILGEMYESFEQWKRILILLLSSFDLIYSHPRVICIFIELMYHQFRQFPKDFFIDEISSNNFLSKLLNDYINFCLDDKDNINKEIIGRIIKFKEFLFSFFGFNVITEEEKIINKYINYEFGNDDNDDDLPVIVTENDNDNTNNLTEDTEMTAN